MGFPRLVERWRSAVQAELTRLAVPIPVELPMSLIRWESGGKPGIVNQGSGASGLGQFKPIAVEEYNRFHRVKISMTDMRSETNQGALIQIRATCWLIAHNWKMANKYLKARRPTVPIDQLVKIADLFYGAGPGATKRRLDTTEPSFEAVVALDPSWWAVGHAAKVWRLAVENGATWDLPAIDNWLSAGGQISDPDNGNDGTSGGGTSGTIITILLIAIGWYFLKKGKL